MQKMESPTQPASAQRGILGHISENSGAMAGFRCGVIKGQTVSQGPNFLPFLPPALRLALFSDRLSFPLELEDGYRSASYICATKVSLLFQWL